MRDENESGPAPDEHGTTIGQEEKKTSKNTRYDNSNSPDSRAKNKGLHPLLSIDPVRQYLNRIKATPRGMRGAVVKKEDGKYWSELATIRFAKDGEVEIGKTADVDQYAPDKKERKAIRKAFKKAVFPTLKPLNRRIKQPKEMREAKKEDLFEFRTPDGKHIIMVQVRVEVTKPDGSTDKNYHPWTYWSDNQWHMTEPDGELPLWGLEQLKDNSVVFLHEGAKAAAHCRWMVEEKTREASDALIAHPWGRELVNAAHLGWIGGAPNPLRTDWSALAKAGVTRVYVVTDNDYLGRKAITPISRALSRWDIEVDWIRFDSKFPDSFDLADPLPAKLFKGKAYRGPMLMEFSRPATWATTLIQPEPTGKRGRPPNPIPVARETFLRQWAMVADEAKPTFVHRRLRNRKYSQAGFNSKMRAYSDVKNLADLLEKNATCQVEAISYIPGGTGKEELLESDLTLNCWRGPVLPHVPKTEGEADILDEYLEHLIPDELDRHELKRWLATLIAHPEIRMRYGVLLFSRTQGTGKSTMNDLLRAVLGPWNCGQPTTSTVVNSAFNDWIAEKQLVFVNEIYEDGSWKAYHSLKESISEAYLDVNKKYVPGYSIQNWAHFILCSNSAVGLKIENDDRRFLVPRVTERLAKGDLFDRLHAWIKGEGPTITVRWAERFLAQDGVKPVAPGDRAPMTERKKRLIIDGRSEKHALLHDLAEAALELDNKTNGFVAVHDVQVRDWLKDQHGRALSLSMIRETLEQAGLFASDTRQTVNGHKGTIMVTREVATDVSGSDFKDFGKKPHELLEVMM